MVAHAPRLHHLLLASLLGTGLATTSACDSKKTGDASAADGADAKSDGADADAENADADAGGDPAKAEAKTDPVFDPEDKEFRKKACEFLTADMVAEAFEVDAGALQQMKIMGCTYTWDDEGKMVEASLMLLRAHDDVEDATKWFANATKSRTKEEIEAQYEQLKKTLDDTEKLDTKAKKNTAKGITDIAASTTPDEGITYTDVPGVGSEARVSSADGTMWVRLGNLTFQVSAYAGPPQPPVDFDPKNTKGMIKASVEASKKWTAETASDRAQAAKKLAPGVVAAFRAAAP